MNDIMLDLETLGTRAGCRVLSIGAVQFGPSGLGKEFYVVLDSDDQTRLFVDPNTEAWWARQSGEARRVFTDVKLPTVKGLELFTGFAASVASVSKLRVWGNGADFDQPILVAAYSQCAPELKVPWQWGSRCFRTLKNLYRHIPAPPRQGAHHNALDDAKTQALHAIEILRAEDLWEA